MGENDKATPRLYTGQLESVGATRLWVLGEGGGAVAIVAEPECRNSNDFHEVDILSPRWKEAMANAERLRVAWNSYDADKEVIKALTEALRRNSNSFDGIDHCWCEPDQMFEHCEACLLARAALKLVADREGK